MMDELKQLVTEQRALIDGQGQRIGALEQDLASIKRQQASGSTAPPGHTPPQADQTAQRQPEMPRQVVAPGEFPVTPPWEARTQSMIRQRVRCCRYPFRRPTWVTSGDGGRRSSPPSPTASSTLRTSTQPGDALKRTQRTSINVTWSPVPQADIALEFLFGTRVNKDIEQGTSSQIQLGWIYRF